MWIIRRYRPSNAYLCIIPMLLFMMSIYVTFYDAKFSKVFNITFYRNVSFKNHRENLSSNDYLNVKLNLTINTAICQMNDNLIVYILSTAGNFQRRQMIRSTWASPIVGTCFVFILGKVQDSTSTRSRIDIEKRQYKDIVQTDHIESYANVVFKEVAALYWSLHFYPAIPYLFKTDDDLIVDSILISSIGKLLVRNSPNDASYIFKHRPTLITDLLSSNRSTLFRGGWAMDFQPALRSGKFGVSEYVWPHSILPAYCSGFGWLMSKAIRNKLVDASYVYPLNKTAWIGDVFVSGFLAKAASVRCNGISLDYEQTFSANCSCLMAQRSMLTVCSSTLHGGGGGNETAKYGEYEKAWKVIQQRHSSDNRTITDIKDC